MPSSLQNLGARVYEGPFHLSRPRPSSSTPSPSERTGHGSPHPSPLEPGARPDPATPLSFPPLEHSSHGFTRPSTVKYPDRRSSDRAGRLTWAPRWPLDYLLGTGRFRLLPPGLVLEAPPRVPPRGGRVPAPLGDLRQGRAGPRPDRDPGRRPPGRRPCPPRGGACRRAGPHGRGGAGPGVALMPSWLPPPPSPEGTELLALLALLLLAAWALHRFLSPPVVAPALPSPSTTPARAGPHPLFPSLPALGPPRRASPLEGRPPRPGRD